MTAIFAHHAVSLAGDELFDGVSDVVSLTEDEIHPAPEFGTLDTQFLTGLATIDDRMLILVDIERLMSSAEMALVDQSAA